MSPSRSEVEGREMAHQVMVEPSKGAELLLSLVRADASAIRSCSAPSRRSGSANWANKADIGLVVHRDPNSDPTRTDIFVRKVRFKQVGEIGTTSLGYDRATGRYFEIPMAGRVGKPKAYADD
jgi:hypothetical protein